MKYKTLEDLNSTIWSAQLFKKYSKLWGFVILAIGVFFLWMGIK